MKKYLLIMAVAALALTSCSSDETIAVNQGDAISFRPLVNNLTRTANGAGLKASWETGDVLHVYADYYGAKLFQDDFTKESSGGFNSSTKHYWPTDISSTKKVTFTAFWGAAQKTNVRSRFCVHYYDQKSLSAPLAHPDQPSPVRMNRTYSF